MLRAMFLPGKVAPDQTAFYVDLFEKLTKTAEYKDYMEKQALKPVSLPGRACSISWKRTTRSTRT